MKKTELFTKYQNVIENVQEIAHEVVIFIGLVVIALFPFAMIAFGMWLETIIHGA